MNLYEIELNIKNKYPKLSSDEKTELENIFRNLYVFYLQAKNVISDYSEIESDFAMCVIPFVEDALNEIGDATEFSENLQSCINDLTRKYQVMNADVIKQTIIRLVWILINLPQ